MADSSAINGSTALEAVDYLRLLLSKGDDWPSAMLKAISLWTLPGEVYEGTRFNYFIEGEAFDWLALVQRLSYEVDGLIPSDELEELLFTGKFPPGFKTEDFKDLLGGEKYRGYLNFFYGVEVEAALLQAVVTEIEKQFYSSGHRYPVDHSEEAHFRIYRATTYELMEAYSEEKRLLHKVSFTLTELKEFTYWLFKRRLKVSDKAKIASDTHKGLSFIKIEPRNIEYMSILA